MLRGLYLSGGALAQQSQALDVVSANLANLNTNGFKADRARSAPFSDVLLGRVNESREGIIGRYHRTSAVTDTEYINWQQGTLEATGNPLDLALRGPGFFVVEHTEEAVAYTRDGAFTVNATRELVTAEGRRVLDTNNQPIVVPQGSAIGIDPDGQLTVDNLPVATLQRVNFTDLQGLEKLGQSLFRDTGAAGPVPTAGNTSVEQGFLERSNVSALGAIAELTTILRSFEASQKVVTMLDETLRQAAADLGRVGG